MWSAYLATVAILLPVASPGSPILTNGGFESWTAARPGPSGLVSGWRLGVSAQVPRDWSLNTAYPGELLDGRANPHSGQHFVRIVASAERPAHIYQMCHGLRAGHWYRVSVWTRGGSAALSFYEYGGQRFLGNPTVAQRNTPSEAWRLSSGFYRPPVDGYDHSALAISTPPGQTLDVDDVTVEAIESAETPEGAADIVLETDALRLRLTPSGMLREFRAKSSGVDYSPGGVPLAVLSVIRNGVATPLHHLTRSGDLLSAAFVDPEVKAVLRVTARKQHLLFEVVRVEPADVEQLALEFPVRRLAKVGAAFNATYDAQFGIALLGTTVNAACQPVAHGRDIFAPACFCTRQHGLAGAGFALVAAPAEQFQAAIMDAERGNGLPCPMLGGRWARDSEAVRHSYLFAVDAAEATIDRTIEYARLGGFGTIIFLKDNWLATHGHYEVNRRNFPDGLPSLRRVVAKIHAAGLGAGVHVFGPSISPNDRYLTPQPDDRLASIGCPPLAAAVDGKATVLTLAAAADLLSKRSHSAAFPGYYLRIGDEIIRYQDVEPGPPLRLVGCQRGALGTKAAPHAAQSSVRSLLSLWSYFLPDPDSSLADEMARAFGRVVNECNFDMVYFDASDGISDAYCDRWYYLNKMHLGYYRQFHKDVLYQTSNGTGTNICWHLIPRSASADGHGDLKGYLDQRWPGVLGMGDNWTRPDVGWYYIFTEVRPDQIEYVAAKVLGIDGSISIETSQAALEKHVYGRRMFDTLGRYEQCRLARCFPEPVRAQLRQPGSDFRLVGAPDHWTLYRAAYERPRVVESLDGRQNAWTIQNDPPRPCTLAVDITCGTRGLPTADYDQPRAVTVETFDDKEPYCRQETLPPKSRQSDGVRQTFTISSEHPQVGPHCAAWAVNNLGDHGGWASVARRFAKPLNLAGKRALALWVDGDAGGEQLRIQLRDAAGCGATWLVPIGFHGWHLCTYRIASAPKLDWSKIDALQFWIQALPAGVAANVELDGLRALPEVHAAEPLLSPTLEINGRRLTLTRSIAAGQGLSADAFTGVQLWTGGMRPGQPITVAGGAFVLRPGPNRVVFTADAQGTYPGDVTVLVSRLWPLEPPPP